MQLVLCVVVYDNGPKPINEEITPASDIVQFSIVGFHDTRLFFLRVQCN
jgi:hypothetical protein